MCVGGGGGRAEEGSLLGEEVKCAWEGEGGWIGCMCVR